MSDNRNDFDLLNYERAQLLQVLTAFLTGPYLLTLLLGLVTGSTLVIWSIPVLFAGAAAISGAVYGKTKHNIVVGRIIAFFVWSGLMSGLAILSLAPFNLVLFTASALILALTTLTLRYILGRAYDKGVAAINERIRRARENGTYHDPFEDMFGMGNINRGFGQQRAYTQTGGYAGANQRTANSGFQSGPSAAEQARRAQAEAAANQKAAACAAAYTTLGLQPGADQATIKSAHRKLVAKWHPDHAGNAGTDKMAAINAAKDLIYKANGWK
jgi:hypothetical protein